MKKVQSTIKIKLAKPKPKPDLLKLREQGKGKARRIEGNNDIRLIFILHGGHLKAGHVKFS